MGTMINILGIHLSHNSAVCLMQDGKIVAATHQERFSRSKNDGGFSKEGIDWILKTFNINPMDIDAVAVGGKEILPVNIEPVSAGTNNKDNVPFNTKMWRYIDYRHQKLRKLFYPLVMKKRHKNTEVGRKQLVETIKRIYGIPAAKIFFVDHHTCHAYTAYYGLREKENSTIVLTLDGEGDEVCATVNTANGEIKRISTTPWYKSLGYIYSQTTTYLGMKALEHEYKVMGLAPYAKDYFIEVYKQLYEPVINIDENTLEFSSKFPTNRFITHLKENAQGQRFDNIAASVQHLTETLVTKWIRAAAEKLELEELYLGGGVFMNVKLNLKLSELDEVKDMHPFPSCGDESNPFGAAYYVYINNFSKPASDLKRIKDLYLGPKYSNEDVEHIIKKLDLKRRFRVEFYKDIEGIVADLLAKGKVVARLDGKSEWGARSLGNRAILGNPSTMEVFYKVNDQIKMRDFWMPFAPTILKERESEYIENPKNIEAPYMIMAFHSKPLAQKELVAAIHQADKTCRPQILEKDWNQKYYKIIKEFQNETGIGGVLNTSFNLHGEPMVLSPEDAIHTLENSGLEYVAIENYLISKK